LAIAAAVGLPAAAASFVELGDAGQTVDSAQDVATVGQVATIFGRIENAFDADLYRLVIDESANFSAQAYWAGSDAPDLQLFLFDAWGRGIAANNDWLGSPLPRLPIETLAGRQPGEYLLGVSGADNGPRGASGALFPDARSGVVQPAGLSRFDVLLDWTRAITAQAGDYAIALTGARGLLEPLAADFDEDGEVDGDDLVRWSQNFGSSGAGHAQGDADGDGRVDGADFLTWQRRLGSGGGSMLSALAPEDAVPEPASWWLAASATALLNPTRRLAASSRRASSPREPLL
jgi:hypothetical protein